MTDQAAMRARLILNPSAGSEAALAHLPAMVGKLRERFADVEVAVTTGGGQAGHAAQTALHDGCTHLFIAGGDGTVNEALGGVDRVKGGFDRVEIGIVPVGTGNDLATFLGLPTDPEACLAALLDGAKRRLDLGRLGDRLFLNASAGGYVAESSDRVDGALKTVAGKLAYLLGGASALSAWEPVQAEIQVDDEAPFRLSITLFGVCNGPTIGGGNPLAPDAAVDDGLLDLCIVKTASVPSFLATLGRMARREHHVDEDVVLRKVRRVSLAFDRAIKVNLDGEVIETQHCAYRVDPGRVRLMVPRV